MSQFETVATVHDTLERVFLLLDGWFERPAEELEARPDYPGAWTIAEHLEHVCLVNHFLLLTIRKGCGKACRRAGSVPLPEAESDLALLSPVAVPDAFQWSPPSHMVPTGRREPAEIRAGLRSQCNECLDLLAGMPAGEGRLCTVRMSVHGLGRLDMYQWLYFLAQHARYHLALIERRLQP
ncbi:MAG TPA: DinB family protein [Geomonas sp.]